MKWLKEQPNYDLTYSDVFLVPSHTKSPSRMAVDLTTPDGIGTSIPLVVANMNAVAGKRMAESTARRGGITVVPQDMPRAKVVKLVNYVHSRHLVYETPVTLDPEDHIQKALGLINKRPHRAAIVVDEDNKPVGIFTEEDAVNHDSYTRMHEVMTTNTFTVTDGQPLQDMFEALNAARLDFAPVVDDKGILLGAVTKKGLVRSEISKPFTNDKGQLSVAVAIGINGDVAERVEWLRDLGVSIIVIDTAHGHQAKMIEAIKIARSTYPESTLIAGNVVTAQATADLISAGADIVKVGVGPGAMCTTRMMTGVGRPQFSAVKECADAARKLGKSVWADGGVKHPRDVALALAAGAGNVMFASWLAGTYESAADMQLDVNGRKYKESYGMASRRAVNKRNTDKDAYTLAQKALFEEGISSSKLYVDLTMPSVEDIIDAVSSGVRSACTYSGASNLNEFADKAVIGVQSVSGYAEGQAHSQSW